MTFRETLRQRAAGLNARIVFPEGSDDRILEAAETLRRLEIADPVLVPATVELDPSNEELTAIGAHLTKSKPHAVRDGLHALELAADPVRYACGLVGLGLVDGCVAGIQTTTADVARAALWLVGLRPEIASLTSAMYHGLPDGRVLTYTDIAIIPSPSAQQLADAAIAAADDRLALVGDEPLVAFLSYSTKGSAQGDDLVRVREAVELFSKARPGVIVDGELQLDAALVPHVGEQKAPGSSAAGKANVLVFPELNSANIAYKLTERLAGATSAGPLLQGLLAPVSDLSRGAQPDDIVDVTAMVALQAKASKSGNSEESRSQ